MNDQYREAVARLLDELMRKKDMAKVKRHRLPLLAQFMLDELENPRTRNQTLKFVLEFVAGKTTAVPPSKDKPVTHMTVVFDDSEDSVQAQLPASA